MMFGNDVQVTDCLWQRSDTVDAYTHIRLLKNGWKSHSYKATFAKHSSGGSTGWQFQIGKGATYAIEVYTSSQNISFTRRICMNSKEYEIKMLTLEDFNKFRHVDAACSSTSDTESMLACDVMMAFGTITLFIVVPTASLHGHLHRAGSLASVGAVLRGLEKLEPMFEPLLAIADMIGDIHPLAKGIVGSFKAIHNVLKGVSQLNKEICALIEDMCLMLRHLDKIKSSMKGNETEELRLILLKMENVMSHTCQFVQNWHDSKRKKGALLTSLSREQVQGIRRLQAQFSDVKSDLDRGIAVDTFVRTRVLSDKLDTIPFPSMQNSIYYSKKDEMGDSEAPPSYDSWGVNPKADSLYTD